MFKPQRWQRSAQPPHQNENPARNQSRPQIPHNRLPPNPPPAPPTPARPDTLKPNSLDTSGNPKALGASNPKLEQLSSKRAKICLTG